MLLDDFDKWVQLEPTACALRANGRCVGYAELQTMAFSVARALLARGVGPGERVALYMPKGIPAIVSVLGVLYSGAAYVPLDPRAPSPRVAQILEICSPRALICQRTYLEKLHAFAPELVAGIPALLVDGPSLDRAHILDTELKSERPLTPDGVSVDSPAYLLYTSGSTGTPKGVVVSHEAAQQFVSWSRRTFSLAPVDRLTSFAPLSFDLSIFDLFGALSSGASVELVPQELLLRPKELVQSLREWGITTLYAVPSTITLLEREGELAKTELPHLRRVLYAGEPFAIPALVAAMQAAPYAQFYNLFGPTETNVCTYHPILTVPASTDTQVPIGLGCDHLTVELLDPEAQQVAPGAEGELCVAGPSVMTEYFRDPKTTEASFYPASAFADGRRRYRTGDRAFIGPDGNFWFCGRLDRMVKRRGYRVELGDIEAALLRHPSIREAAVVSEFHNSEIRISAFVSLQAQVTASPLILRAHCGSLLPPYMVPDSVEIIEGLPRTLTGKVDFQLLRHRGRSS
jgi:amino acid adenylation domain-containing protein